MFSPLLGDASGVVQCARGARLLLKLQLASDTFFPQTPESALDPAPLTMAGILKQPLKLALVQLATGTALATPHWI